MHYSLHGKGAFVTLPVGWIPYYGRLVTTTEILVAGKVRLTHTKIRQVSDLTKSKLK